MADATASTPYALRRWLFRLAWVLLAASLLVPAPDGSPAVGPLHVSAASVYAQALAWNAAAAGAPGSLSLVQCAVIALALFSHILFIYALYLRDDRGVANAWKAIAVVAFATDASIAVLVPSLARMPAYWIWLAAIAVLAAGFAGFGGNSAAQHTAPTPPSDIDRGDVPAFVWVLLGFTLFWIAVSAINHASPPPDAAVRAARDSLTGYVNDRAHVLTGEQVSQLTFALQKFEKTAPSQVAVAIYPGAPGDSIDDFTIRTAEQFPLGERGLDTGAILFVFMRERAARLEVGYGLEGTLTDADSHRILDEALVPAFARGAYFDGLDATLSAIFANVESAYQQGRMPGKVETWQRKLVAQRPTRAERMWRAVSEASVAARVGSSLLGALILLALWNTAFHRSRFARATGHGAAARQATSDWGSFARDIGRGVANLRAKRPFAQGMERFDASTIWDTLRGVFWIVVILTPTAGVILIAGGGSFGGAGSLIHW